MVLRVQVVEAVHSGQLCSSFFFVKLFFEFRILNPEFSQLSCQGIELTLCGSLAVLPRSFVFIGHALSTQAAVLLYIVPSGRRDYRRRRRLPLRSPW